jgi:hypothetical protein
MEDVKNIEFWRIKAHDWEWLYKEQKDACEVYKKIIYEYRLILGVENNEGDAQDDI